MFSGTTSFGACARLFKALCIKISGIFIGVLARAFFPWLRKLHQGKVMHFHKRYLYLAIGSVIVGMIITLLVFPKV